MKAGGGALRAVRITMMKTVMRKRARTAPMMAPAMAMELDLWAWDCSETKEAHSFSENIDMQMRNEDIKYIWVQRAPTRNQN